jgi:hypothetical protein
MIWRKIIIMFVLPFCQQIIMLSNDKIGFYVLLTRNQGHMKGSRSVVGIWRLWLIYDYSIAISKSN